jgi:hypothetical protein
MRGRDGPMSTDEQMVPLADAIEQVRRVSRRLGLLHISFARTLVEELGEEQGKQLVLKAIKAYGIRIGQEVKVRAAAEGLSNEPVNYVEDVPAYGMHDNWRWIEAEGEKRIRAYGCVMAKVWNDLGEQELGRLYCYVDPSKYMTFNPHFKLYHVRSLPDGDEYCEVALRPTTEQERLDFADEDKDWSYIDR